MTIRFTQTAKWEDSWFRKLKLQEKVLFLYICDKCNSAGFWEIDLELASIFTGIGSKAILGAYKGLIRAYVECGNFIWLRNFLRHQRNWPLNPNNNAHKQIISQLQLHSEFDIDFLKELEIISPKRAPNQGPCKGRSKGNGKGNSKVELLEMFEIFFAGYPRQVSRGAAEKAFVKLAPDDELFAVMIAAVKVQLKSKDWMKEDGQYIPYPASWINGKKWKDKLTTPKQENDAPYLKEVQT